MRIASIRTVAAVGLILGSFAMAHDAHAVPVVPVYFTTSIWGSDANVSLTDSVYWSLTISNVQRSKQCGGRFSDSEAGGPGAL